MRVAALYDIHGNLPALEAVLDEISKDKVDLIVVGGDVVPGPMPKESISTLLNLSIPVKFIKGNGENDILTINHGTKLTRVPARYHSMMRWVETELPDEHLSTISLWPLTLEINIPKLGDVLFCHATPCDDNEIFTRLTPEHRLKPIFDKVDADVVICGHTHMQFDRNIGKVRVVNAGSVGMPFGKAGAYWILLSSKIEFRHTSYNLAEANKQLSETEYPLLFEFNILQPQTELKMLKIFEAASLK